MASIDVKECEVCNNEFNEDERCPRILPCYHSLCTFCISQLIDRNDKKCPFCRGSFEANSAQELRIDVRCLDFIKYIKDLEDKIASPVKAPALSRSKIVEEMKKDYEILSNQHIASCQDSRKQIKDIINRNNEVKSKIQNNHMKIKGDILAKLNEFENSSKMEVQFLEEVNEGLEKKLDEVEEKEKEAESVRKTLHRATTISSVDAAIDEAEASNAAFQSWLQNFQQLLSRGEKLYEEMKHNVRFATDKTDSLLEVLDATRKDQVDVTKEMEAMKSQLNIQRKLTSMMLKNMNTKTKNLVKQGRVYAVQCLEGKRRFAKISIAEDMVLLHHLKEGTVPNDAVIIEHPEAMSLVDPSSRLTFLEFGTIQSRIGRVFIRLTPDSKRAENFALLCTAVSGPCYQNSDIFKIYLKGKPGESIQCGDYERNNKTGGKTLVPGAGKESGGILRRQKTARTVFGLWESEESMAAQFGICIRDDPSNGLFAAFGNVESNIQVLYDIVAQHSDVNKIKIIDCGIVLNV